jgi:hypothetical protein
MRLGLGLGLGLGLVVSLLVGDASIYGLIDTSLGVGIRRPPISFVCSPRQLYNKFERQHYSSCILRMFAALELLTAPKFENSFLDQSRYFLYIKLTSCKFLSILVTPTGRGVNPHIL